MRVREQWVRVQGFPNYLVSNYGRVENLITGRTLKNSADPNGYERVCLTRTGGSRFFMVHRLVAQHFLIDYDPEKQILHRNEIRSDNAVLNLIVSDHGARPRVWAL